MKKKIQLVILTTMSLLIGASIYPVKMSANSNVELPGASNRKNQGGNYWKSSNLREWANAENETVQYTNAPPTASGASAPYDKEPGFLYEFSSQERESIAVTEHRVYLSPDDSKIKDGGTVQVDSNVLRGASIRFNIPNVNNYTSIYYHKVNDKVFLLNSHQLQQFVEQRGIPSMKTLTPEAKRKHNRSDDRMSWWIHAPTTNIGNDNNQYVTTNVNSVVGTTTSRNAIGFVPAMHLKPDTLISNKKASSYKIGETLLFGRYLGKPIEWRVINRATDGSPLLISEKVIDIKSFDASGDAFSYAESRYTNFSNPTVLMKDSDTYVPFDGFTDITEPTFKVTNDEALFERSNASFVLNIEVKDTGTGVDFVEMPDGTITKNTKFSYTVFQNTEYVFKATDKAGNVKVFTVPVSNINPESSVIIKPSVEGWTNQNVTVDISASNNIGFENKTYLQGGRDYTSYTYPNFTSYKGKRFRITGTMELTKANAPTGSQNVGTGFAFRSSFKRGDDYYLSNKWIRAVDTTLSSLEKSGKREFDMIYTVPGDYYEDLKAWSQININSGVTDYAVRYENLTYELLDNDDFGISKIILPTGKEITSETYRDVLTTDGTYLYQVLDNRGKTTKRTVEVKIDKGLPTLNVTPTKTGWTKEPYVLEVKATDALSGVKQLILPNGETVQGDSFRYLVNTNGTYQFTAVDVAGNRKSLNYTVSNFDTTAPNLTFDKDIKGWTKNNVKLSVKAIDSESGVDAIRLPNGSWVTQSEATYEVSHNGTYTFSGRDKLGNIKDYSVTVENIDKTNPVITIQVTQEILKGQSNVNIKVRDY